MDVKQQTVALWEMGKTEPSNDYLKLIAAYFGVTTDYLLGCAQANAANNSISKDERRLLDLLRRLTEKNRQQLDDLLSTFLRAQSAPALAGA